MKYYAVIDTNVLVSAMLKWQSVPGSVLEFALDGMIIPVLNSAIGRNAVLVKGVGAVCAGKTRSDAEAIAMIVSKNCAAACYTKYAKPLGNIDSRLLRYTYLTKYSKQMEA